MVPFLPVFPVVSFLPEMVDLAEKLGLEGATGTPEQRLVQVRQWLKARPYLVIVDNLETDAEKRLALLRKQVQKRR